MSANTKIQWAHHTMNPWWGCQNVSPGCDHCYAEALDKRFSGAKHWGPHAPRRIMSDNYWKQPLKWDRAAEKAGERHRVFCASMADVFDNQAPEGQRDRLWRLIRATPNLDWLLLTKRPQNIAKMHPGGHYPNVWMGTTTEDQERLGLRHPHLINTEAAVHFLSVEPMLGPVFLREIYPIVDWVIVGGESGPGARPCHIDWIRSIIEQCRDANVACFVKQLGARPIGDDAHSLALLDKKGGDTSEWPEDLRVREMPS